MDENTKHFIDRIADMGFTYWQVLPFNPTDSANSPYCSPSAFAGNYIYINPQGLKDMGLISDEEVSKNIYDGTPYTASYEYALEKRLATLKKAFLNVGEELAADIKQFEIDNPWLTDYAVFMAVKEQENFKPWWEWSSEHAHYFECIKKIYDYEESAAFWKFVQYIFYKQWAEIKKYANKKGVAVIGDMPIYVAMDSVDVWSNLPMFLIDEKTLKAEKVAGVPPDYFSEDGQLWGNPLYDYDAMKADGYGWWIRRIDGAKKLYDVIRIDHFRGFESYWAVPSDETTAKNGHWKPGPGMDLVGVLTSWFHDLSFIAEDLGYTTPGVRALLADSGLPGMKVLQFAFDAHGESDFLPHKCTRNSVCYIGTHDNDTVKGWLETVSAADRKFAERYMHITPDEGWCWGMIRAGMSTVSDLFVVQMQDILELPGSARMNTPGTLGTNWQWRMLPGADNKRLAKRLRVYTETFRRL